MRSPNFAVVSLPALVEPFAPALTLRVSHLLMPVWQYSQNRGACTLMTSTEWNNVNKAGRKRDHPASGFAALSRRSGRKPVIAAVNGICFGGGCEAILNCDMVVASKNATFALPEVKRGVVALAGALPRLIRTVGKPRAMEMALTGRTVPADEAYEWGMINKVVSGDEDDLVKAAVNLAKQIAGNSPDSIIVTRESVKLGWEGMGAEDATRLATQIWFPQLNAGDNLKEGVLAFVEKRKPQWKASKL